MPEAVLEYFAVSFASKEAFLDFSLLALKACEPKQGSSPGIGERRPVVFQSLIPGPGPRAFVSRGAAQLVRQFGSSVKIATVPTSLAQLPTGLALLVGDAGDASDYGRRTKSVI